MNITRNTMRADGITVGESLDREAAFLRSIGIPASDGQKPYQQQLSEYTDRVREAVLNALDQVDGKESPSDKGGWRDEDLSLLFKAVDAQAETQFWRNLGI